jgi:hypothetical protein
MLAHGHAGAGLAVGGNLDTHGGRQSADQLEPVQGGLRAPQTQQQTTPPPSPPTPQPATAEQPKKNWLLPLALAGALGTGAAIPLAMDAMRPDATPAITEPVEMEFPQYDVERWVPE